MPDVSIVIPIFDEGASVVQNTMDLLGQMKGRKHLNFEVLYIENGSTDQTPALLEKLMGEYPSFIRVYHLPRPDYGAALRFGLGKAKYERVFVFQTDSTPMGFFDECLKDNTSAMVLGSRRHPDTKDDKRPWIRRFLTSGLNLILAVAFKSPFHDTHGIKFIRMSQMSPIIKDCKLNGGIFETEMVLRANLWRLPIREVSIPVKTYSSPKKSYLYKITRNAKLILLLFVIFYKEGLCSKALRSRQGR